MLPWRLGSQVQARWVLPLGAYKWNVIYERAYHRYKECSDQTEAVSNTWTNIRKRPVILLNLKPLFPRMQNFNNNKNNVFNAERLGIMRRSYSTTRDKRLPIIYLFTKEGCTLCDQAKQVLTPYRHRFTLLEVDIELPENADWFEKYKYDIPVFHLHEDFLFMHRVDLDVLERALSQYEHRATENDVNS